MGRGKSALKPEDIQVFNAARWFWWLHSQEQPSSNPDIYIGAHEVYRTLKAAFGSSPLSDEQINYRLKKLGNRGLLEPGYYGRHKIPRSSDPYIAQQIDDWKKDREDQQQYDEDIIKRLGETVDALIPGHGITIRTYGGNRTMGYPTLTLVGPAHQIRMLLQWAEAHVKAMDAAAMEVVEVES